MANPRIVPEDQARPGDRIADLTIHEPRANIDALGIDKHVVKLGEPFDALLCLQGGALRAIYSAGVLDTFLDMGLSFKQVVGVSAGTLMGIDYVCGDRGASAYTNLVYATLATWASKTSSSNSRSSTLTSCLARWQATSCRLTRTASSTPP